MHRGVISLKYSDCPLYGLQSKKMLKRLLHIEDSKLTKQDYIASLVSPYIDKSGKPRLIEPPREELKAIQKRLKKLLGKIVVPDNVFSGIKGRSYADNAKMHMGSGRRNLFKIDLTAFFPSIDRDTVYRFFSEDLNCSSDVAQILALIGLPVLPEHQIGIHRNLSRVHPQIENLLGHREEVPGTIPLAAHLLTFPFIQSINLSLGTTRRLPTCNVGKLFSCISS